MHKVIPLMPHSGDEVRVIAPSSSLSIVSKYNINLAVKKLQSLGFTVSFGKNVFDCDELKSSSIKNRIQDLHTAFLDKKVKGILSAIGGTNTNTLLPYIDWSLIKNNPKFFCGFSDITVLQNALFKKTGMITFSGPHFSTFAQQKYFHYTLEYFIKILTPSSFEVKPSKKWSDDLWWMNQRKRSLVRNEGIWYIKKGEASGTIIGGNIDSFRLLVGTQYMPDLTNTVLFLETDDSQSFAVFLSQLAAITQHESFFKVNAIIIGRLPKKFSVPKVLFTKYIKHNFSHLDIPILANLDFGHTNPMFTFPIGGKVHITKNFPHLELSLL